MGKTALVLGAGGFIGSHLVTRLKDEGYWVRGVDIKYPEFSDTTADQFCIKDLRYLSGVAYVLTHQYDEIYQLAADMGGAGFVFSGEHDADIMYNSSLINLNVIKQAERVGVGKIFFSSSACIYPASNQMDPNNPVCSEESAYPANPDSEYGWEKLFSERIYLAFKRNYGIDVRIARFHNIFGKEGTWMGGREKAPAALCRKVAMAENNTSIEIWGDGLQTRSFLYIGECLEGIRKLMSMPHGIEPVNIGSEEMVTINDLAQMTINISGKNLTVTHNLSANALGVRGRSSDNRFIKQMLGWEPNYPLIKGLNLTYDWIKKQISKE